MSFKDREKKFQQIAAEHRAAEIAAQEKVAEDLKRRTEAIPEDPRYKEMMALAQDPELHQALRRNWEKGRTHESNNVGYPFEITITPVLKPEENKPLGKIVLHCEFSQGWVFLSVTFRENPEKSVWHRPAFWRDSGYATGTDAEAGIAIELYATGRTLVFYTMDSLLDYFAERFQKYPGPVFTDTRGTDYNP